MLLLVIIDLLLLPTGLSPVYNLSLLEVSWRWSSALLLVGWLDGQAAAESRLHLVGGGRLLLLLLGGRAAAGCCLLLLLLLGGGLLLRAAVPPLLIPATWRRSAF